MRCKRSSYACLGAIVIIVAALNTTCRASANELQPPEMVSEATGIYDRSGRAYSWRITADVETLFVATPGQEWRAPERNQNGVLYRFRYTLENRGDTQARISLERGAWIPFFREQSAMVALEQSLYELLRPREAIVVTAVADQPPELAVMDVYISAGEMGDDERSRLSSGKASVYVPSRGGRMVIEGVERYGAIETD